MAHIGLKIFALFLILLVGLGGSALPIFWKRIRQNPTILSFMNCFSGGVFLGIALEHFLNDGGEAFWEGYGDESRFPFPYFLAGMGQKYVLQTELFRAVVVFWLEKIVYPVHSVLEGESTHVDNTRELLSFNFEVQNNVEEEDRKTIKRDRVTAPLLLLLALGAHTVFFGIAIGLEGNVKHLLTMIFACVAHKWAAAMALSISCLMEIKKNMKLIYIILIIFNTTTPMGVILGLIFSGTSPLLEGTLMSFSAGTFLYVSLAEIVVHEFEKYEFAFKRWMKFLCFVSGFSLLSIVAIWG